MFSYVYTNESWHFTDGINELPCFNNLLGSMKEIQRLKEESQTCDYSKSGDLN
jgi:hypothetical protein